jgi:hypothetical protein
MLSFRAKFGYMDFGEFCSEIEKRDLARRCENNV